MQIVENWARLCGRVEAWEPASEEGGGQIMLCVRSVDVVPRPGGDVYPSLFRAAPGTTVRVRLTATAAAALAVHTGQDVAVDVRRGRDPDLWFGRVPPAV